MLSSYLARRFGQMAVTLLLVTILVFLLARIAGDPTPIITAADATDADREFFRRQYGLDQPWPVQYLTFISNVARGDFGVSFRLREPAIDIVLAAMGPTLQLALCAMILSVLIGLPLGVMAAQTRRLWLKGAVRHLSALGLALPPFWVGLTLISVFALNLQLLPSSGFGTLANFVLPTLTLACFTAASISRLTQINMEEALKSDFIFMERMLGLSEARIVFKHALRNAALPIVTFLALQFGLLLGGAIVTERVFSWPGLGQVIVDAILHRDYPVIQAAVFVTAVMFLCINLAVDILYAFLDPRVRI